jgi:hypothetical protein
MSHPSDLARLCDQVLTSELPAGLACAVRDGVARGLSVADCERIARDAGAGPLLLLAVQAEAERLVRLRDAERS